MHLHFLHTSVKCSCFTVFLIVQLHKPLRPKSTDPVHYYYLLNFIFSGFIPAGTARALHLNLTAASITFILKPKLRVAPDFKNIYTRLIAVGDSSTLALHAITLFVHLAKQKLKFN